MLLDEMRKRLSAAIKTKNEVEREVLRVAMGEVQTLEARNGRPPTDEDAAHVIRKLVKANEETLAATSDPARRQTLEAENQTLRSLLPKTLTAEELVVLLGPVTEAIQAAANDGQATGVAMKELKAKNIAAQGGDVSQAVKKIRAR